MLKKIYSPIISNFFTIFFRNLSCEEELPWNGGTTLLNYISSAKFRGLTGPVSFAESKRTNFKLDLLKLKDLKMAKVGEWTPLGGLNITDKYAFLQGKISKKISTCISQNIYIFFLVILVLITGYVYKKGRE